MLQQWCIASFVQHAALVAPLPNSLAFSCLPHVNLLHIELIWFRLFWLPRRLWSSVASGVAVFLNLVLLSLKLDIGGCVLAPHFFTEVSKPFRSYDTAEKTLWSHDSLAWPWSFRKSLLDTWTAGSTWSQRLQGSETGKVPHISKMSNSQKPRHALFSPPDVTLLLRASQRWWRKHGPNPSWTRCYGSKDGGITMWYSKWNDWCRCLIAHWFSPTFCSEVRSTICTDAGSVLQRLKLTFSSSCCSSHLMIFTQSQG